MLNARHDQDMQPLMHGNGVSKETTLRRMPWAGLLQGIATGAFRRWITNRGTRRSPAYRSLPVGPRPDGCKTGVHGCRGTHLPEFVGHEIGQLNLKRRHHSRSECIFDPPHQLGRKMRPPRIGQALDRIDVDQRLAVGSFDGHPGAQNQVMRFHREAMIYDRVGRRFNAVGHWCWFFTHRGNMPESMSLRNGSASTQ